MVQQVHSTLQNLILRKELMSIRIDITLYNERQSNERYKATSYSLRSVQEYRVPSTNCSPNPKTL
jgi:hypothetical protein